MNGDGRPDIFVAGYSDPNTPVPGSLAGFPTNIAAVRDLLYLNEGPRHVPRGRDPGGPRGGAAAARARRGVPRLQPRPPARSLRRERRGSEPALRERALARRREGRSGWARLPLRGARRGRRRGRSVCGHGRRVAADGADVNLFVTNSRHEPSAAFRVLEPGARPAFADARSSVDPALGSAFAGWGASFVDLLNSGNPALVLTAGAIPVTNLADDAEPVRVLAPVGSKRTLQRYGDARGVLGSQRPAAERARPRRGRRRQRRPHGHRDQHDRRQARAPLPAGLERTLARRASSRGSRPAPWSRRSFRMGGCSRRRFRPGAATSPRRIRASTSVSARRRGSAR